MYVPQHPWLNRACKVILQKIVAQVPIAGPLLSDIVNIVWPAPSSPDPTPEEQFNVIKEYVSVLIEETLAERTDASSGNVSSSKGSNSNATIVNCLVEVEVSGAANCIFVINDEPSEQSAIEAGPQVIEINAGLGNTANAWQFDCTNADVASVTLNSSLAYTVAPQSDASSKKRLQNASKTLENLSCEYTPIGTFA